MVYGKLYRVAVVLSTGTMRRFCEKPVLEPATTVLFETAAVGFGLPHALGWIN